MFKPVRLGCLVLAAVCLVPFQSAAQSAPPIADTFSNSAKPTTNYGTNPIMMVQPGYTSYVQFSLSTLPAGAVVQKATLRLFLDSVSGKGQIDVYEAANAWNEALLNYNNEPLLGASATGGHPVSLNTSTLNQFVLIDVTPLVAGWVNGSIPNNGVAIALVGSTGSFSFDTKESTLNQPPARVGDRLKRSGRSAGARKGLRAMQGRSGPTVLAAPLVRQDRLGRLDPPGPNGQLTGARVQQGRSMDWPGATGAQGPFGPIGPQGIPGAPGTNGTNGTNGTGFNFREAFSEGNAYQPYDVVTYGGSTYEATVAIAANGATPDLNPAWTVMALAGSPGANGATGHRGATGPSGPIGMTGTAGPTGPPESTGSRATRAGGTDWTGRDQRAQREQRVRQDQQAPMATPMPAWSFRPSSPAICREPGPAAR